MRHCVLSIACAAALSWPSAGRAELTRSEAAVDLISRSMGPGSAGIGWLLASERSPYRGAGQSSEIAPAYLYEGERFFLRSDRLGVKFEPAAGQALSLYLRRRLDGFALDAVPPALAGMAPRTAGLDLGVGWRTALGQASSVHASLYRNIGREARGGEFSIGAHTDWEFGRLTLRPAVALTWRSSRSNAFRFGVLANEATATRPAYSPGAGIDAKLGLYGSYALTSRWRLLSGVGVTRSADTVQASPIVESGTQPGAFFGAVYAVEPAQVRWGEAGSPTWVRVLVGAAFEDRCDMVEIVTLRCTAVNRQQPTEIAGLTLGKTLVERLNGWPLDITGHVGFVFHQDRPYQPNGGEIQFFLKPMWTGFPWSDHVKTRLGLGWGVSYAEPVPYAEVLEQRERGRENSRLLNYIDASIDLSLGDLLNQPEWRDTFVGLAVVHRSGMFAESRLLGRVNGGSNYVSLTLEQAF